MLLLYASLCMKIFLLSDEVITVTIFVSEYLIEGHYVEYILYCDESIDKGKKYGDFFGGCIISSKDLLFVSDTLSRCKEEQHLFGEIKWTKVTDQYLEKYKTVIHEFFNFVRDDKVKVRIMFRDIHDTYSGASNGKDDKYFKLYYQFIKHGFGFLHTKGLSPFFVRIYLDQLPSKADRCLEFKQFLRNMPKTADFKGTAIRIRQDQIAEVASHDHVLLQCIDIILGAMQFRLNEHHLEKPAGQRTRGKKTIAKEKLYQYINREICTIHSNFNIGVSTGARGRDNPHWDSPYEHWKFIPSEKEHPASST